jgi:hypothetical protein
MAPCHTNGQRERYEVHVSKSLYVVHAVCSRWDCGLTWRDRLDLHCRFPRAAAGFGRAGVREPRARAPSSPFGWLDWLSQGCILHDSSLRIARVDMRLDCWRHGALSRVVESRPSVRLLSIWRWLVSPPRGPKCGLSLPVQGVRRITLVEHPACASGPDDTDRQSKQGHRAGWPKPGFASHDATQAGPQYQM